MENRFGTELVEMTLPATSAGSHAYGWDNGVIVTDTWTVNGAVLVKTYSYNAGQLVGESDWVKQ